MNKYIECDAAVKEQKRFCGYLDNDMLNRLEIATRRIPAADVVARDCYNRILAENDAMREQLAKIGKKPGDSMDDVRPERYAQKVKFFNDPWTGRMFTTCTACDGKVGQHDKFCKHCGAKFEEGKTDEPRRA